MLLRLTRKVRLKAALALAVLYALCLMAPTVAIALGLSEAMPCFTGDTPVMAVDHSHAVGHSHHVASEQMHHGGMDHQSHHTVPATGSGKKKEGACCALLCLTAVTPHVSVAIGRPVHAVRITLALDPAVSGRGPVLLDRPPSTTFLSS